MPTRSRPAILAAGGHPSTDPCNGAVLSHAVRQLLARGRGRPDYPLFEKLAAWRAVPICLWPTGLDTVALRAVEDVQSDKPLDVQTTLVLNLLATPPRRKEWSVIAQHEETARSKAGGRLIRARHKFVAVQRQRRHNAELAREWGLIKAAFDVAKYRDSSGMIQQEFMQDQDLRMDLRVDWRSQRARFRTAFGTFCHRWNLRGMHGDTPILLSVEVQLTPFGTVISLPAYWSLDYQRDFRWRAIRTLHRIRSLPKQGSKLSRNQAERRKLVKIAKRWFARATTMGLKGTNREDWVMGKLRWDSRTDPKTLWRLLKEPM